MALRNRNEADIRPLKGVNRALDETHLPSDQFQTLQNWVPAEPGCIKKKRGVAVPSFTFGGEVVSCDLTTEAFSLQTVAGQLPMGVTGLGLKFGYIQPVTGNVIVYYQELVNGGTNTYASSVTKLWRLANDGTLTSLPQIPHTIFT